MIEIIPAIDMIGGECVRLTQGDYTQKTTYFKDPLDAAKQFADAGIKRLHLVDLDGAKAAKPVNLKVLERIVAATSLDIQYGGGIKSESSLEAVFNSGAKRAICGSIAIKSPEMFSHWLSMFGAGHIILGADVMQGRIAINGWKEHAEIGIADLIDTFLPYELSQVICTDISKDGMLQGPSFEMYADLQKRYPEMNITVSGGISSMADIERLDTMGMRSVIVGKAFYEGRITIKDFLKFLNK